MDAAVFDLFGTLVPEFGLDRFRPVLGAMASAVGMDSESFSHAFLNQTNHRRHTGGFPSLHEEILWICEASGVAPADGGVLEAVRLRVEFTRGTLVPRDDAIETLRHLRSMGLRIGLISNCSVDVPELWPETPFRPWFDALVFSSSVGMNKPDPGIYAIACERLGVPPEACLYVADGVGGELAGAAASGMRPVLLAPPGEGLPDTFEWEGRTWNGEKISSLSEVVTILEAKRER